MGAGYESVYYGINNVRSTESERGNGDLAFIGPLLREIQPFKNSKIYQEMYERAAGQCVIYILQFSRFIMTVSSLTF